MSDTSTRNDNDSAEHRSQHDDHLVDPITQADDNPDDSEQEYATDNGQSERDNLVEKVTAIGLVEAGATYIVRSSEETRTRAPSGSSTIQTARSLKSETIQVSAPTRHDPPKSIPPSLPSKPSITANKAGKKPQIEATRRIPISSTYISQDRNTSRKTSVQSRTSSGRGPSSRKTSPVRPGTSSGRQASAKKSDPSNKEETQHQTPELTEAMQGLYPTIASEMDELNLEIDPDAAKFSESVDKWTGLMRRAIIADFIAAKSDLLRRQKQAIEDARQSFADEVSSLSEQLNYANSRISGCERKAATCERLMEAALRYLERKRGKAAMGLHLARWRIKYAETRRLRIVTKVAARHANQTLAKKAFMGWRLASGTTWRRTVERKIRMEAEKAMEQMAAEYDKRVDGLNAKLATVHARLEESEAARAAQTEDMKKAFMRGVCALNLEAMSMFRPPLGGGEEAPPGSAMELGSTGSGGKQQGYDGKDGNGHGRMNSVNSQRDEGNTFGNPSGQTARAGLVGSAMPYSTGASIHSVVDPRKPMIKPSLLASSSTAHQPRGAAFVTRHQPDAVVRGPYRSADVSGTEGEAPRWSVPVPYPRQ